MPETSIVIKSTDRYSENLKKMAAATKSFTKDVDKLEDGLHLLSKNKVDLKLDLSKARKELNAAEKQFRKTHDEADRLALELAQTDYDEAVRRMKLLTSTAKDMETQLSKSANQAGMFESIFSKEAWSGLNGGLAQAGIYKMLGDAVSGFAGAAIESAIGQPMATLGSSVVSGIATGAAAGALLGTPGIIAGATIGGISGLFSGGAQIYEKKDDAFKSYVEDVYGTVTDEQSSSLTSGSSIAGSREQTRMTFAQRMGEEEEADAYLERVKTMATSTNYGYDEITGYSKLLLNTYDGDKTLSVLQTLSDASAGLNLGSSDVNVLISGLSRMRTTGKATQEYLNYFSERGVDVYQALANATGADKSKISEMVTGGKIGGEDAAEAILTYINETYGGLSEKLSTTYDAMVDNLADYQADMDAAMGEGYNEGRKVGLQAQMDWMSGESGTAVEEANRAIGAWQAELENSKEQYIRDAMDAMMASEEYQTAKAEDDAAEMGKLIMQAKVQGMNEYNASEGAQLALEAEKSLVESIRSDTQTNQDYWNAGYEKSQWFTKGLAAGISAGNPFNFGSAEDDPLNSMYPTPGSYAVGIDYVPYDNFPVLLHQGERVLTAEEARSEGSSGGVQIVMNGVTIREDADIDRVAAALLQKMELAGMRG